MPFIIPDSAGQLWQIGVGTDGLLTSTTVSAGTPSLATYPFQTTTAQAIVNSVSQDIRGQLATSGSDTTVLLDYINRVSLELLRASRWKFLLSPVQHIVTQQELPSYWLGPIGDAPPGAYDTGLDLSDVRYISPNSVFDRSNFHLLERVDENPNSPALRFADDTARPGRPRVWRNSPDTPNILDIFPGPDNQNNYQPEPAAATVTTISGGALSARVYYVSVSFVDSQGNESTPSQPSTKVYVPAGSLLKVTQPYLPLNIGATGVQYNRWKVYASTTRGGECLQSTSTPLSATSWTESTSGLVTGTLVPQATNSLEPIDGYIIEFRYIRARVQISSLTQVLQIPDDYKDVVVAGTNWLTNTFLDRPAQAMTWYQTYQKGIGSIIRDRNWNGTASYISPDPGQIYSSSGLDV